AMPDVAGHTSEKDVGVTAFESARHRQFGNGMTLPKIFAQKQSIDTRGVAAHDHVLIIIRKNLRLNEVARTQQVRQSSCFTNTAKGASLEHFRIAQVSAFQFLPGKPGNLFAITKFKMPGHIRAFESCEGTHAYVVELCQQKRIDEMATIDCELRVID